MKKHLVFAMVLVFISLSISAQKSKDALYLKDGSIIYGKLIEILDNRYKIQTSDGSLFVFSSDEVDKFLKEAPAFNGRKDKGLGFSLESGVLVGSQNSEFDAPFSFNLLLNCTSGKKNIFGIGSGVEFLGSTFSPVFLEYKRLFNDRKTTPFIFFRGGGMIHTGDDEDNDDYSYQSQNDYTKHYKGGSSLTIGTGISWVKDDYETYLSFGYRYAQTSYKQKDYNSYNYTYKNYYNRLEIKFGFKF